VSSPEPVGEFIEGTPVRVLSGLPSHWGQPLGVVRGVGPKMVRVELFYDESIHYFTPEQLRRRSSGPGNT